jgi:hypothetical protein
LALTLGHVNCHQGCLKFTFSWFIFKFYLLPSPVAALKCRRWAADHACCAAFLTRDISLEKSVFFSASRGLASALLNGPCLSYSVSLLLGTRYSFWVHGFPSFPFQFFSLPAFLPLCLCRSVAVYPLPYLSKTNARSSPAFTGRRRESGCEGCEV